MATEQRLTVVAVAAMVALCATWGFQQVTIKLTNEGISTMLQVGLRSLGAGLLLWIWSAWRGVTLFERDGTLIAGIFSGVLFAAEFVCLFGGLHYTAASRGVIFIYTAPFVVAIGTHILVPEERLRPIQVAGLLAAFAGVVIAFGEGLSLPTYTQLFGDALMFAGGVLWGLTTVLVKATRLIRISANKTLFYQLAVSALILIPLSLVMGEPGIFNPTPLVMGSLAFQIVVVAFASFLVWYWLITLYPANRLSAFSFMTPLFGMLFGHLLLGESISPLFAVSAFLVALGIWLVNAPKGAT